VPFVTSSRNAIVIKLTREQLESLLKVPYATQIVITEFEGRGEPDCICVTTTSK
jgi:hypothetical protein